MTIPTPVHIRRVLTRGQLVGLLAPTLGHARSEAFVASAAKALGFPLGEEVRVDHALAILDHLGHAEGLVGVAARFVRVRGELDALIGASPASQRRDAPAALPSMTPGSGVHSARMPRQARVSFEEIALFVAPALGDAAARESVARHAAQLGVYGTDASRAEASQILDSMSSADGILGVVASFAKARFILKYPQ